jgi:hypothetical protein
MVSAHNAVILMQLYVLFILVSVENCVLLYLELVFYFHGKYSVFIPFSSLLPNCAVFVLSNSSFPL